MRILIVGSNNTHGGKFAPFIVEQADALRAVGCEIEYYGVMRKGIKGYLQSVPELRKVIREKHIDIVHAHFGLSGLMCCLQRLVPVVVTYHGSDINLSKNLCLSKIAMRLSAWNIFVSQRTMNIALGETRNKKQEARNSLIPCGINMPKAAEDLPNMAHVLEEGKRHVLFAGAFDNAVKDPELAKRVIALLNEKREARSEKQVQLIELKGYSRDEVNALMYACDAFLMTSKTEGSPQVVKEAMACSRPIVSTNVGDVKERLCVPRTEKQELRNEIEELLDGCYVAESRGPEELAELLEKALAFGKRTEGRKKIENDGLTNDKVAEELIRIYKNVLKL